MSKHVEVGSEPSTKIFRKCVGLVQNAVVGLVDGGDQSGTLRAMLKDSSRVSRYGVEGFEPCSTTSP